MTWTQFLATLVMNPLWMWPEVPTRYEIGERVMHNGAWNGGEVRLVELVEVAGRAVDYHDDTIEEYWYAVDVMTGQPLAPGFIGDRFFIKLQKTNWWE